MLYPGEHFYIQGCFIKCEILQSPMILYRSLLFIATTMNDKIMQIFTKHTWLEVSAGYYVHMHFIQFIKMYE